MQEVRTIEQWDSNRKLNDAPETQLAKFSKDVLAKFRKIAKFFDEHFSENFTVLHQGMQELFCQASAGFSRALWRARPQYYFFLLKFLRLLVKLRRRKRPGDFKALPAS